MVTSGTCRTEKTTATPPHPVSSGSTPKSDSQAAGGFNFVFYFLPNQRKLIWANCGLLPSRNSRSLGCEVLLVPPTMPIHGSRAGCSLGCAGWPRCAFAVWGVIWEDGSGQVLCSSLTWRHSDRVFGFQGCPGLCPPVPPPSSDAQRAEEHPSSAGHAHHHQVKPLQGWDGACLSNLTCAPSLQLGDMGQDRQWWASGYRSSAPWSCQQFFFFLPEPRANQTPTAREGQGLPPPHSPTLLPASPGAHLGPKLTVAFSRL